MDAINIARQLKKMEEKQQKTRVKRLGSSRSGRRSKSLAGNGVSGATEATEDEAKVDGAED
jgi:hypothetical protein